MSNPTRTRVSDTVPVTYFNTYVIDGVGAGEDSTALVTLDLPGPATDDASLRKGIDARASGLSYIIDMHGFGISSSSANFETRIMTIDNIALFNTTYSVATYAAINLYRYTAYNRFYISNMDTPIAPVIYLYFANTGGAMGATTIQLNYTCMKFDN